MGSTKLKQKTYTIQITIIIITIIYRQYNIVLYTREKNRFPVRYLVLV